MFTQRTDDNVIAVTAVALLEAKQDEYRTWSTIVVENTKAIGKTIQAQKHRYCFERNW